MPITAAVAMMGNGSFGILMPGAGAGRGRRGGGGGPLFSFHSGQMRSISEAGFQDFELSHEVFPAGKSRNYLGGAWYLVLQTVVWFHVCLLLRNLGPASDTGDHSQAGPTHQHSSNVGIY